MAIIVKQRPTYYMDAGTATLLAGGELEIVRSGQPLGQLLTPAHVKLEYSARVDNDEFHFSVYRADANKLRALADEIDRVFAEIDLIAAQAAQQERGE